MFRLLLTILSICACACCFCQQAASDTLIKDTAVQLQQPAEDIQDNIPTISLQDNDLDEGSTQTVSSLLTASRDPFYTAASFNFGAARFRIRGYDPDQFGIYINNIPMDNLDNGFTPFGLWGGLNDVMRNREIAQGLRNTGFAFGDVGGTTNIDMRASKQRKQTSLSYALSNRNYTHRLMLTHSTGIDKHGWSFSFSASRRYASEGYVPGTFYNGWSYYAGVDKKLGAKNILSLFGFGSPLKSGRQSAAVEEMITLSGTHYYNPYWGYQKDKKRNASVATTNQPVIILTHDLHVKNSTSLITSAAYSFGERSISNIDWYNAPDPRPDYYRYLPGFYSDDAAQYQQLQTLMQNDINERQINWQRLYDINRDNTLTIHNADGITGNDVTGKRSKYIISDRTVNTKRFIISITFNTRLNEHFYFTAGANYQLNENHYYQKINDLLGGDFYVDLNQFAERDFPNNNNAYQNDLNHPNRIVKVGDAYGYNYNLHISKASGWIQAAIKYNKTDIFFATELSATSFYRKGNVRNGLFPDNSFGKSATNDFLNHAVKAGFTYKFNGRMYLFVNGTWLTRAPYFENAYISPRTRNTQQDKLISETVYSTEGGFILNAPKFKLHVSGYYTQFLNGFDVLTFYHDQYQNFVNYALSNIDKLHFGGELGIEVKPLPNITLNAAVAVGRYYYNSRQKAIVTLDNSSEILTKQTVYSQNYRIGSTPQNAYNAGITYRSPKFWFVSLNGNYFTNTWLNINPLRRSYAAIEGLDNKNPLWSEILTQRRFQPQYTIDFFGGYSWKLPKQLSFKKATYLVFYAGVNNILNNKNMITGGYEQLRFDFTEKNVDKFPPKLYYGYGLNYFLNVTLRF